MRKLIFTLICLFFLTSIKAQHCRWDGKSMIMVKVNHPSTLEDSFKIELLKLSGEPAMMRSVGADYKIDSTPAMLWKNPPEGTTFDYTKPQSTHFPFVKSDYYIISDAPRRERSFKARITYLGKSRKRYKPVIIDVPEIAVQHLCQNNVQLWRGNVQPVIVDFK